MSSISGDHCFNQPEIRLTRPFPFIIWVVTDRVRSEREGNVFTGVLSFCSMGGQRRGMSCSYPWGGGGGGEGMSRRVPLQGEREGTMTR